MPRKARLDAPGAVHHIIIRGIERRKIFRSDPDRSDFIERLAAIVNETQTQCLAWALIPNHVHLLFRTGVLNQLDIDNIYVNNGADQIPDEML
jgi:REP element-mobilizing transposase RayT